MYDSLPEEDKQLLTDASAQAVETANEQVRTSEEEVINELAGDNFQIVEDVDRQAFADISTSQIEAYYTENDLALTLEEVRNIIRD